jgi:hypothetical protein
MSMCYCVCENINSAHKSTTIVFSKCQMKKTSLNYYWSCAENVNCFTNLWREHTLMDKIHINKL